MLNDRTAPLIITDHRYPSLVALAMHPTNPNTAECSAFIAKAVPVFKRIADTIVEAFNAAQLDPQQAAKIQEIAAQLKEIRDRPRL